MDFGPSPLENTLINISDFLGMHKVAVEVTLQISQVSVGDF